MKTNHITPTIYYPIFLNARGKKCVVVGGGTVALRKVKMLLDAGAKVTVISPKPHPDIEKLSRERAIRLIRREYEAGDLKGAVIAIACTDVKEVNRRVADEAKKAGVLVNIADDPKPSDFIVPSFFRQGEFNRCCFNIRDESGFGKKDQNNTSKKLRKRIRLVTIPHWRSSIHIKEKGT